MTGNPGHRPINVAEPRFAPASLVPPDRLDVDARAVWEEYAAVLWGQGILTHVDVLKFESLCVAAGRLRQLARAYAEAPNPIVTSVALEMDESGGGTQHVSAKPNPLLGLELRYMAAIDKFAGAFGMDPSTRSRIKASSPTKRKHWLDEITDEGSGESQEDRQLH